MCESTNEADDTDGGTVACLDVIENWFKSCCNGIWEHRFGFSLETMDNPGWRASFQLYTTEVEVNSRLADWPHRKDVEVSLQNGHIRIYSESLTKCLEACVLMMAGAVQSLAQTRADVAARVSIRILIGWIEDDLHPRLCDEGEFVEADADVSDALRVLGYTNSVKILSRHTFEFDLDAVSSTKSSSTTLILVRSLPINLVEIPCPRSGFAVYEQREDRFVLASSSCKFHEDGKIAIKSSRDEKGNDGIYYWLTYKDSTIADSVNIILQK